MQSGMMSLGIVDSHAVNIDFFFTKSYCSVRKRLYISNIKMIITLNLCNFPFYLKTCEKIVSDEAISRRRLFSLNKKKSIMSSVF